MTVNKHSFGIDRAPRLGIRLGFKDGGLLANEAPGLFAGVLDFPTGPEVTLCIAPFEGKALVKFLTVEHARHLAGRLLDHAAWVEEMAAAAASAAIERARSGGAA